MLLISLKHSTPSIVHVKIISTQEQTLILMQVKSEKCTIFKLKIVKMSKNSEWKSNLLTYEGTISSTKTTEAKFAGNH